MIAKFNITDKDLIAQQKNAIKTTKFHRKSRIMQLVISFLGIVLMLIIINATIPSIIFCLFLYFILTPFIWRSYEYLYIRRYKRDILRHNKNKIGPFTLNLSEEKLVKESQHLTEKIQWNELNRFKEDQERYFLYFTDLNAITIKKEPDNMNEQEIKEYQAFIKRKVKKKK
ncbi:MULTISPECIES: YcxB family protein [Virgibacillus]|uniref:YcxB family protein n=1 Tax=Virgibacillus TaxID=84406 RepID=UPI00090CCEB8|nr:MULTISPECIES: YcxB family protein [Virgibacillus]API93083.1 hypothetical protein BKP57_15475 [Virgibacillus sp. 6R]MBS7427051.1 YcxB family protein [Virgibacillus sp. 19R1-5]MBU8568730.1 YcxB family protein [Virgibacillus pantothenticus]MBU8602739.1 YcxB family protein [Virgibacillus pantothenticus]MBU8636860.1 YcxB family protein [Virgibacillus pantothenticus]